MGNFVKSYQTKPNTIKNFKTKFYENNCTIYF